jgi:hypothetical protein
MSTWNGKYVSLATIIEKIHRNTKGIHRIDFYDAIEWAGEALELIGSVFTLKDSHTCIEIEDYKGKLPCDLYLIMGVREYDHKYPMRYTTDTFHSALVCQDINMNCAGSDLTYSINQDYMFTSFQEGTVEMSYKAIPTDDMGYPLIPDDIKFIQAVQFYILERLDYIGLRTGSVQQYIYEKSSLERDWYIAAAQNRRNLLSIDGMESLKNNWLRLIPKINQHSDNFKTAGNPEERRTHNIKGSTGSGTSDTDTYTYIG